MSKSSLHKCIEFIEQATGQMWQAITQVCQQQFAVYPDMACTDLLMAL